jgi:hypothetical protein
MESDGSLKTKMAELPKEEPEVCPAFLFIIRSTTLDKGGRYE